MLRPLRVILFLVLLAGSAVDAEVFTDNDLSEALKHASADTELNVIVRLKDRPGFSTTVGAGKFSKSVLLGNIRVNASHGRNALKTFFKTNPVREQLPLWHINGLALTADAGTIKKLVLHPAVRSVTLDETFSIPPSCYSSKLSSTWNVSQIHADKLWSLGFTGSGVVVAVMDTGADIDNPHLQSSYRGGTNSWFDPTGTYSTPYDSSGHGTQVLGIILGSNDIDTPIGIAPSAQWIAAKIFNDAGLATVSGIHLAFQWLLDPDDNPETDDAPHIVNCSWGLIESVNQCVTEFQQDVELLRQAGIAVVFAAGNESVNPLLPSSVSPANYPESLSVGAVDSSSTIVSSSSRGPSACDGLIYPKLVAPGSSIETCDLSFGGLIDQHVYVDGTSFAAPHVSAAFALLMQAFSDANSMDIEAAMITSAADLGDGGADNTYGNGQVDVYAAYQVLASGYCSADLDHNCSVDLADLQILISEWLNPGCSAQSPCRSDLNSSHEVDFDDFSVFASQFMLNSCNCSR
jgi:subtilisin family serine protease